MDCSQLQENIIEKYEKIIEDLLNRGLTIEDISSSTEFQEFRENNLICFGDAVVIDEKYTSTSGDRWMSAYNYPVKDETIYKNNEFVGKAVNVGLLTFSIM